MHDVIAEDPDVRQAIEDKIPDVAEIRDLVESGLRKNDSRKSERARDLLADVYLRADRLRMEVHDLIRLVSRAIDRRPGHVIVRVSGKVGGLLRSAERRALEREYLAQEALTVAQQEMAAATRDRHLAQSRCLIFGIEVAR